MLKYKSIILSVILLFAGLIICFNIPLEQSNIYVDKNQYFAFTIPNNWSINNIPNETIRSKVVIRHSSHNILIRILAEPTNNNFSFDELYTQNVYKQIQLQEKYPDGKYELKKGNLGKQKVLIHRNTYFNGDEHEVYSFVENGIVYTVAYNAATLDEFTSQHSTFDELLRTFLPLPKGKTFSKEDIKRSILSKEIRIKELEAEIAKEYDVSERNPDDQYGGWQNIHDANYHFMIKIPPSWVVRKSKSTDIIFKAVSETDSEFAMVTIIEDASDKKEFDKNDLDLLRLYYKKTYNINALVKMETINGVNSIFVQYSMPVMGLQKSSLTANVLTNNKMYTIEASCDESQYLNYKSMFDQILKSFRIE